MSISAPHTVAEQLNSLVERYYGVIGSVGYAEPLPVNPHDTVLLLVDVQEHITPRAVRKSLATVGIAPEEHEQELALYETTLLSALANIERVLTNARQAGIRVLHVGIQALLPDAEDTGMLHRAGGMLYPPGSDDSAFLSAAAPAAGEIVLTKTCSGVHVGTHIDQVLRNLGVNRILVAGFYTDQCISSSVRDLADIGYQVGLIEDAMGAMSPERHLNALQSIRKLYANSETTESILARLGALAEQRNQKRFASGTGRHR